MCITLMTMYTYNRCEKRQQTNVLFPFLFSHPFKYSPMVSNVFGWLCLVERVKKKEHRCSAPEQYTFIEFLRVVPFGATHWPNVICQTNDRRILQREREEEEIRGSSIVHTKTMAWLVYITQATVHSKLLWIAMNKKVRLRNEIEQRHKVCHLRFHLLVNIIIVVCATRANNNKMNYKRLHRVHLCEKIPANDLP